MNKRLILIGSLLVFVALFGCTTNSTGYFIPPTAQVIASLATCLDANQLNAFDSNYFDGNLVYIKNNKFCFVSPTDLNVNVDLTGYVPYTGATQNVDLGEHDLTATNLVANGDFVFNIDAQIRRNTDDGSDNGYLTLTGGGGSGTTRGAIWQLFGNETIGNAGSHIISLGNVAGANLNVLDKDSTTRFYLDENGIKLSTTGTQVSSILDEDNMASNSATALATQQSIKAYVDSQAGGYDNLTEFVDQTPWRMFYSNTDGDVTELALGDSGKVLQSNGASAAPTWETPNGGSVSFGSEGEIPYTNATTDDFNYSNKLTFGQSLALTPSLQMSGNANEYARIPSTEQILTNQFSISAWFLADSSSTGYLGLISKRTSTAENILLRINGSGGANDGKMEFVGISQTITSANSVRDGNWHHVVVRRDGSNVISMWIDGVQQATTYTAATNYTSTSNWHFGRSYSNTTTEVWKGRFQQTVLWVGSSLSNNDIADIYNSGVGLYMNLSTTLPTDSTAVSTNCKWFLPWEGFAGDIGPSQYAVTSNLLTFPNFVTGHVPYPSSDVLYVNGYVSANGFATNTVRDPETLSVVNRLIEDITEQTNLTDVDGKLDILFPSERAKGSGSYLIDAVVHYNRSLIVEIIKRMKKMKDEVVTLKTENDAFKYCLQTQTTYSGYRICVGGQLQ